MRLTRGKTWEQIYGSAYAAEKRAQLRRLMSGRVVSQSTKAKLSRSLRAGFKRGRISNWLGKHLSESAKQKISEARRRRFCIHGHDTHKVGRNSSFCCRRCAAFERHQHRAAEHKAKIGNIKALRKIYDRAHELRQWFDVVVDHIRPLTKRGRHTPDNLQIIYRNENNFKGDRLNYVPSVIFS